MDLEKYFRTEAKASMERMNKIIEEMPTRKPIKTEIGMAVHHTLVATVTEKGIEFYIHPTDVSGGETADFTVKKNKLEQK